MNPFAKKFLGVGIVCQLAVLFLPAQTAVNFGNLPLWFEANHGQVDATMQFIACGRDSEFLISPTGVAFVLGKPGGKAAVAQMRFVGANPGAQISGGAEMRGKINYLVGNDPARWQSEIPIFGQVRAEEVYPGVNVVYYGNQQRLEYDFDLAAGVKPETIAIRFDGAEKVSVNLQGELIVNLDGREIIQHQPVAYQISDGARHEIQVGYKILDAHTVAFAVSHYNRSLSLVIDPVLSYSTYFGGNNTTVAWAMALGTNDDSIYIAGQTLSVNSINASNNIIPFTTTNAYQTNFQGGTVTGDAFVAKFDSSFGTNLIYCTYLGGNGDDAAYALAVGANGNAFVAGVTESTNFPVKKPVIYQTFNGSNLSGTFDTLFKEFPDDAFVTELETNGSSLIYSTYLGGESSDAVFGLAVDPVGDAFVTGVTYSTNFPVTTGAYQPHFASVNNFYVGCNAFVSEIAAGGNTLNYSSYLGGTNVDVGHAISFNNGYVAVAGSTCSSNFPTINYVTNYYNGHLLNGLTNGNVNNNLQNNGVFINDAFVTLFQTTGSTLTPPLYSTFLGGTNNDVAYGVAVDASGDAYVAGFTTSTNFPNTTNGVNLGGFVSTNTLGYLATNAFLTQIKWNGTNPSIGYSQIFGGYGVDQANGVALDAAGNVFIVGSATSTNIPVTTNLIGSLSPTNASYAGYSDAFVTVFKADFSSLLYSAYLGGENNDYGYGIAVDSSDNAYIVGQTLSTYFPTFNARQKTLSGGGNYNESFLAKIIFNPTAPVLTATASGTNVLVSWTPVPMEQFTTNDLGLETGTNLLNTNWMVIPSLPVLTNGSYTYTFNRTNQAQFFRFYQN